MMRRKFIHRFVSKLAYIGWLVFLPDKQYLSIMYWARMTKCIDWNSPKSFNEKIQWLKLYDRKTYYTALVDKSQVKDFVVKKIGRQYVIPTLGVYDSFNEIDFNVLPNKFVMKCTHDSGGVIVVNEKKHINYKDIKAFFKKNLKRNYYTYSREWPYKNVKPRILIEECLEGDTEEILDYKFMCFNGKVKCSFVCTDRFDRDGLKVTFFDREWNVLPFERHYKKSQEIISKPRNYDKMIDLAEELSMGIPFVRVDFYNIDGYIYFGEMTFYPGSGYEEFTPEEWDITLGEWITLPTYERI